MIGQFMADLKKGRTDCDLTGEDVAIRRLLDTIRQGMLEAELAKHLAYEKYSAESSATRNGLNGKTQKAVCKDKIDVALNRRMIRREN